MVAAALSCVSLQSIFVYDRVLILAMPLTFVVFMQDRVAWAVWQGQLWKLRGACNPSLQPANSVMTCCAFLLLEAPFSRMSLPWSRLSPHQLLQKMSNGYGGFVRYDTPDHSPPHSCSVAAKLIQLQKVQCSVSSTNGEHVSYEIAWMLRYGIHRPVQAPFARDSILDI